MAAILEKITQFLIKSTESYIVHMKHS